MNIHKQIKTYDFRKYYIESKQMLKSDLGRDSVNGQHNPTIISARSRALVLGHLIIAEKSCFMTRPSVYFVITFSFITVAL